MFYEEIQIREILKCPKCGDLLNKPMILQCCGESICERCIPETEKSADAKCSLCGRSIEENNNYQPNKALSRLIDLEPVNVYRDDSIHTIKQRMSQISSRMTQLKLDTNETLVLSRITEHCGRLRNEVLARSIKAVDALKSKSEEIISMIDSYEKSCLKSFQSGKESFEDQLKRFEEDLNGLQEGLSKLLSDPEAASIGLSDALVETNRLRLRLESMRLGFEKLIFTREMLEYHECKRAALGCLLVTKKLSPTYDDLTPLHIKEDLLDDPELLFTYFQIGFLNNGKLILSVSDADIFKTIYLLDLTQCECSQGYMVKKHDLFTKKSPIFDTLTIEDYILNSEFDFKLNSYEIVLRDQNLNQIGRLPYMITDTIDIAVDSLKLYLLRQNKTVDVYRLAENGGMSFLRTINIATMCRRNACAPCCSCFWTTPASFEMEFKVKDSHLFFKSVNRIWIFQAKGSPEDGPYGSFSLYPNRKDFNLSEVKKDIVKTNWVINSKNEIIVHLMDDQKLVYFDLNGQVLFERDLSDFPKPQTLSFCLDQYENVFFFDNENIYV